MSTFLNLWNFLLDLLFSGQPHLKLKEKMSTKKKEHPPSPAEMACLQNSLAVLHQSPRKHGGSKLWPCSLGDPQVWCPHLLGKLTTSNAQRECILRPLKKNPYLLSSTLHAPNLKQRWWICCWSAPFCCSQDLPLVTFPKGKNGDKPLLMKGSICLHPSWANHLHKTTSEANNSFLLCELP